MVSLSLNTGLSIQGAFPCGPLSSERSVLLSFFLFYSLSFFFFLSLSLSLFLSLCCGDPSLGDLCHLKVLLVGNPGSGKSLLLNSLIGKADFHSGFSLRLRSASAK